MYVRGTIDPLVDIPSNSGLNMPWKDEKVLKNTAGPKYTYPIRQ